MSAAKPQSLRPISPLDARLADIAETWFPESWASGDFDVARLYQIAAAGTGAPAPFFGMVWPGKEDAITVLREASAGALLPDTDASLSFENANHVFCVGDNLEIMKLLQPAYFGRFKMAYLDAPYNTPGDFIYPDDTDDPVGRYLALAKAGGKTTDDEETKPAVTGTHARWLSMMLPRLFMVRNLLRDDGVVFVVVGDQESHRLRMLMDEVFGEEGFVCNFVWEKRYSPAPDAPNNVGYVHDNVLCYRKSDTFKAALLPMTEAQKKRYKNRDHDPRGPWKPADYTCRYTDTERPNLYYPIVNPHTHQQVWPKKTRVWAHSPEEHENNVKENLVWWPEDAQVPAKKSFLDKIAQGAMPRSLLTHEEVGHSDEAAKELREVLTDIKVTPKPTRLVRHLCEIAGVGAGDLVLDPFAGVGTAMAASADTPLDKRQRIVSIEFPEALDSKRYKNLADAGICRARATLKKSSGGLRVYRLARTGIKNWNVRSSASAQELQAALQLAVDPIDKSRSADDLLTEVALQAGCRLTDVPRASDSAEQIYTLACADVTICLAQNLTDKAAESLAEKLAGATTTRIVVLDSTFRSNEQLRIAATERSRRAGKLLQFI
jgi:adenine-specific DNA-methyltransferase